MWPEWAGSMGDSINFYSHIPCGMWPDSSRLIAPAEAFLLTHPVWDVTRCGKLQRIREIYFYSHIPCGMWLSVPCSWWRKAHFYSHIPCGMWRHRSTGRRTTEHFYSHIPCGMWRKKSRPNRQTVFNFYSHIPCGMWLLTHPSRNLSLKFLLTHPVWDVTKLAPDCPTNGQISTHTSRVGCDLNTGDTP